MKTIINGISVEGTPEEIRAIILGNTPKETLISTPNPTLNHQTTPNNQLRQLQKNELCINCNQKITGKRKIWKEYGYCTKKCASERKKQTQNNFSKPTQSRQIHRERMSWINSKEHEIRRIHNITRAEAVKIASQQWKEQQTKNDLPANQPQEKIRYKKYNFTEESYKGHRDRMNWINQRAIQIVNTQKKTYSEARKIASQQYSEIQKQTKKYLLTPTQNRKPLDPEIKEQLRQLARERQTWTHQRAKNICETTGKSYEQARIMAFEEWNIKNNTGKYKYNKKQEELNFTMPEIEIITDLTSKRIKQIDRATYELLRSDRTYYEFQQYVLTHQDALKKSIGFSGKIIMENFTLTYKE